MMIGYLMYTSINTKSSSLSFNKLLNVKVIEDYIELF
jgi:hypothetical protein